MSIKKRLFISNILMIASPIFLTFFIIISMFWGFTHSREDIIMPINIDKETMTPMPTHNENVNDLDSNSDDIRG